MSTRQNVPIEELRSLLAAPPYPANALSITDAIERKPAAQRLASGIAQEAVDTLLGIEDGGTDASPKRVIEVGWTSPAGPVAAVRVAHDGYEQAHREVLLAARCLGVGVHCWMDIQGLGGGRRFTGSLFVPRNPLSPGALAQEARILESSLRFDATVLKVDRPGLVARKVMRRSAHHDSFTVVEEGGTIEVTHETRRGVNQINLNNRDLLGIVHVQRRPLAICTDSAVSLPKIEDWSRVDFRGREFASWCYETAQRRLNI